jgi:glycosyltransferase involved in cell wall biosynthesis
VAARLSIYHPAGRLSLKGNPFGKDVANLQMFQALGRYGGFEQLDVVALQAVDPAEVRADMLGDTPSSLRCTVDSPLNQAAVAASGALLRGQPQLDELAWLRRRTVGDRAYSLLGLVHTIAPPAVRQTIAMSLVGPTQPWDAVICTSPSVQQALTRMFEEFGDHLGERMRGVRPPQPQLPLVPLGVDGERFAALADRPQARAGVRAELGLGEDDLMVLWVGRLSFFEKAFPQPMFKAVDAAARTTRAKVVFVMAGWFANGEADRERYEAAARAHAPGVEVRFVDGNDPEAVGRLWAGADVFLSLVDNVQETFGLTPLEAMAAGLPVVASDWDGYRYTIRDGVEGFLAPTLLAPAGGLGAAMSLRHILEAESYQIYVGALAQHAAVHIGRAAEALGRLFADRELRRRMGQAGRERVRTSFDWKVVAPQVNALVDELAQIRARAANPATRHAANPVKGDPFRDFAGFASRALSPDLPLRAAPGAGADKVRAMGGVVLDVIFPAWRASLEECAQAVDLIASGRAGTVQEVLDAFPPARRRALELGLVWLAKHGLVDWPT